MANPPAQVPASVPKTFLSLQYLRALACLVVLYGHGMQHLDVYQPGLLTSRWEASAVDVFFVLSGFVMWHMTSMENTGIREYARRRFCRAVPFYWLVTGLVALLMLAAPGAFASSHFDAAHVLASLALWPWPHPVAHGQILPVIIPGWTFEYEIFFYVLLGVCLLAPWRSRALWLTGLIVAVTMLPLGIRTSSVAFQFYTQPVMLEFAAGILLGWMLWRGRMPDWRWGLAAMAAGCALIALIPSPIDLVPLIGSNKAMAWRVASYMPAAVLLVGGALAFERQCRIPRWNFLKKIGDASYSIYIVHPMVLAAWTKLAIFAGLTARPSFNLLYLAGGIAVSLAVGLACHRWVEMPLFKALQNRAPRQAPPPRAAVNQPA